MTMKNLIDTIRQCQKNKGLTDTEFAKRLGYKDRSSWAYIKSGRCPPTLRFFRGVIREFPELKSEVDRWMYPTYGNHWAKLEIPVKDGSSDFFYGMPQGVFERRQDSHRGGFRAWLRDCIRRIKIGGRNNGNKG